MQLSPAGDVLHAYVSKLKFEEGKMNSKQLKEKEKPQFETPTDLSAAGVAEISKALRQLLAAAFALYLKTKNLHWHIAGPHFRDYHLLLDEHGEQIFAMTVRSLSEPARSGPRRFVPLAISRSISARGTTTRSLSHRKACSKSSPQTAAA